MDRQYVTSVLRVSVTLCRQALSRRDPYRQTVINETPCHLLMMTSLRRCRCRTSLLLNSRNIHLLPPATCEGWLATDGNQQGSASVRTGGNAISTRWTASSVWQRPPAHAPTPKSYNSSTMDVLRLSGHISPCGPHATALPSAA